MTTVAIVGAGEVGGAAAHALAVGGGVGRLQLIDRDASAAAGKALDILQAGAIEGFHTSLSGSGDDTRAIGCDVCVLADPFKGDPTAWNGEEGLALIGRLARMLPGVPLVLAGSGHLSLIDRAARELGIPRSRLIGSAPEALASAIGAMVALEAGCSPAEVSLTLLGVPPKGVIVPWGEATVGGYLLTQVLEQVQLLRIEARVAHLWPPGPYALGQAAAEVVHALLTSSRRARHVLTPLDGEFGIRRRTGILPVLLSPAGIAVRRTPALMARDRVQLETVLDASR
jgi:malate/lactate dehydrogenase